MSEWFAVIDAARDHRLHRLVARCSKARSLYDEPLDPDLVPVAPYLVQLRESEPLLANWRRHGRGKAWGIMVESDAGFDSLRVHFRKFLKARLPDGGLIMFRFYDPIVLSRCFLHAQPAELALWFAKVRQFIVDDENAVQHAYRWRRGMLFDGDCPVGSNMNIVQQAEAHGTP